MKKKKKKKKNTFYCLIGQLKFPDRQLEYCQRNHFVSFILTFLTLTFGIFAQPLRFEFVPKTRVRLSYYKIEKFLQ